MNDQIKEQADAQRLSRVVLTGFMGAGKSTVGALLAQAMGWRFLDLDEVVEAESQLSVAQIFRDHGEAGFRARERQTLHRLHQQEQIVLALGGGTMEDESSRSLLIQSPGNCLVFLEGNLADLIARCTVEGKVRPLLAAPEIMEARLAHRLPFYRQAHVTVVTTGLAPHQVAGQVLEHVTARWRVTPGKKA